MVGSCSPPVERDAPEALAIRFCREDDLPALEWDGMFTLHRGIMADAFARQQHGSNLMLVADVRGRLVGQVWVDLSQPRAEDEAVLWALRVHPTEQGHGFGTALLHAAEAELAARGFRYVALGVERTNTGAQRLYQRLGYSFVGPLVERYTYDTPDGEHHEVVVDQWLMRKALPPAPRLRAPVGIRWTVGAVSRRGFEALRLSILGACRLFGPSARYTVNVNTCPVDDARRFTGEVPETVQWRSVVPEQMPVFLRPHFDSTLAEGVGWKFIPLQVFGHRHELALDNDCILWEVPDAIERWLTTERDTCVIAEDIRACFGKFHAVCGSAPRNSGIRGVPPSYDFASALRRILQAHPVVMESETDGQGLQVGAVCAVRPALTVTTNEVTICSPFSTHQQHLGRCGAHFVGLNAHQIPWDYDGRPAVACIEAHWRAMREEVEARLAAAGAL